MQMSFLELRSNPGPMTSSTPKKLYPAFEELTNGSALNGDDYPESPTETEPTHPMSPVQMTDAGNLNSLSQTLAQEFTVPEGEDQSDELRSSKNKCEPQCNLGDAESKTPPLSENDEDVSRAFSTVSYSTLKKHPARQNQILKQRLLSALVNLIPHRRTLSLRLLVNYTIDDKDSESLVIDETLCRQSPQPQAKTEKPSLDHSSDSGCVATDGGLVASKRPRSDSRHSTDTHVLDLSVHTECDELELEEAMNTELDESVDESNQGSPSELSSNVEQCLLPSQGLEHNASVSTVTTSVSLPTGGMNPLLISSSAINGNGSTVFTASPFPPMDSSLLTLLPLLQQQLPQSNIRVFGQPKVLSNIESLASITTSNGKLTSSNAATGNLMPETAESLLFRELQALIRSNGSMNRVVQEVPPDSSVPSVKASEPVGGCVSSHSMPNLLNTPLNTSSLIGFPLFNTFSPDQLTAVQTLLPPASFLNNALSAPNITSLNLGSATLLNLKDKTTGQETLGIMQGANRHVTTPVANLLNHINIPQATSISLKTLSTLSQLFNNTGEQNASKLSGSPVQLGSLSTSSESRHIPTELLRVSEKRHNDSPVDPIATTQSNELRPPNLNISVPPSQEGMTKSGFVISDLRLPPSSPVSLLGSSDTPSAPVTNGLSSSTYGTNQFIFGRRLAHARRFTCNQCRKNFASLAELNRHTLEAHNSFKCTICSAHFTQRSNLQRHSLKHVGFKPFTCNLCKKEYYRKDHLVRHIEVTHPNHDPKMNITVHLTSSECLDYLDRLHAGKQTPSPGGSEPQELGPDNETSELASLKVEEVAGALNGDEAGSSTGGATDPVVAE